MAILFRKYFFKKPQKSDGHNSNLPKKAIIQPKLQLPHPTHINNIYPQASPIPLPPLSREQAEPLVL